MFDLYRSQYPEAQYDVFTLLFCPASSQKLKYIQLTMV